MTVHSALKHLLAAALAVILVGTGALTSGTASAAPTGTIAETAAPATGCELTGTASGLHAGSDTDWHVARQPIGVVTAVMLFVDFSDAPAQGTTQSSFQQLSAGETFLEASSGGRLDLQITPVHQWMRMPNVSTSYPFQRGISYTQHQDYIRHAVTVADPQVDFSEYDIVYVVANREARAISFSPTYLAWGGQGLQADGTVIKWAVTFGYDMWSWGPKVLAHETGHVFGMTDLYAFSGDAHGHVGGWDLMGLISGPAPGFLGWHRWKMGWIDASQVRCIQPDEPTVVTVRNSGPGPQIAVVRTSDRQAYVIESRRATGPDTDIVRTGALLYRVDSSVAGGSGPIRVIDATPNSTPTRGHQLDDGAWQPGQVFIDQAADLRIEVISANSSADTLRISRIDAPPPPMFTDVPAGSQFRTEIAWFAAAGISTGTVIDGVSYFQPSQNLSRQALAAFLYRYAGDGWAPPPGRQTFADVPVGHQFHTAVEWMADSGLSTGSADPAGGKPFFQPNIDVSRQATAAFLHRLAGSPAPARPHSFTDVGPTFATAISWLAGTGITTGYSDGTFRPNNPIARDAIAAFLYRFDRQH